MKRSRLAISSLWLLGLALAVLLPAGTAEGQTQQWTKYEGNPVLEHGEPGDCDEGVVDHSEVLFDGVTYHMWYAGGLVVHDTDICYATSTDGVHWDKWPNPVLLRGAPGEWDAGFVQPGAVIRDGGIYRMWYGGCVSGDLGPCETGYATSPDGVTWTKFPDDLKPERSERLDVARPRRVDGELGHQVAIPVSATNASSTTGSVSSTWSPKLSTWNLIADFTSSRASWYVSPSPTTTPLRPRG